MAKMTPPEHEEKDRLGDQLHRKEKADEDRYAAERDRELIAKMRAARPATAAGTTEGARDRCPKCGEPLNEEEHGGIRLDSCGACGGVWLERAALESILEQQNRQGWLTRYLNRLLHR